ncbi:MAG: ABC transporter permease [Herbinix sp.]|nr:ABC transporter permease [Herbinix sp.]
MTQMRLYGYHKRRVICIIIALIAGVFLWIASIINQMHISEYHQGVSVRYDEPALTKQSLENILEAMISRGDNHIPEITLWQRDEHFVVSNEDNIKTVELSLITVAGDMSRIYPVPMLYGGYLARDDSSGCIIDRATAYKLFGSSDTVGLRINCNNKEYIIRGVIKEIDSNVIIVQEEASSYKGKESKTYSCMEMSYADTKNAKLLAERFVSTNGLGKPSRFIDGYLIQMLSYVLIHIPLWVSALLIVIYVIRKVYLLKASPILTFIGIIGIALLVVILIKITNMHFYYPNSMIPNKWSDFDFWVGKLRSIISSISRKEGIVLYYRDIILRRRMLIVIIGVISAVISELSVLVSGTIRKCN